MVIKEEYYYYNMEAGCIPGRVYPGIASVHSQVYTQVLIVLAIYPVMAMEHPLLLSAQVLVLAERRAPTK